jgi:hypothetical protein
MIYLDSSAVVKLVRREPGSDALAAWLQAQGDVALVSSCLVEVEVPRAIRRYDPDSLAHVEQVIARLYKVEIDVKIRAMAAAYDDRMLRSLDAIHLATAELLESATHELAGLVAYDDRLLVAAQARGLKTVRPA